ncbi:MAG: hypothetical protein ABMA64_26430 [Myxococcota bacterium]
MVLALALTSSAFADNVSVTIHSNCPQTVKVFFGENPGFSSGTKSSVSSNSTSSYTLASGSKIWILDASEKPVSSTTVGTSSQRIEISKSCTGFGA